MSDEQHWDDSLRNELRDTLRSVVLGEVRMTRHEPADILDICREAYIEDECPADEQDEFLRYAEGALKRATSLCMAEQATWPSETDCDRLDRAEAALRDCGILLWQASPCCDTCTGGDLPNRIDEIEGRHPGFRERVRGYAFFIEQTMAERLADSTELRLYLAYGWFEPDDSDVHPSVYKEKALAIGREVCECLREHGFEVDWDGDFSRKIGVPVNWQRRTMLK